MAVWLAAIPIFLLRVVDVTLYTVRLMMVVRGRKVLAWVFAFFQSFVFVTALRMVLSDMGDWAKYLGYSAGFATGILTGMWLEARMAVGYTHLRVVSPRRGAELTEQLREAGFAVTVIAGIGRDGAVDILNCSVLRRQAGQFMSLVQQIDSDAFMTTEDVRKVDGGFWRR